ncbi:hypothetical protein Dimus_017890 [Dionaea muscipula]
MANLTSLPAVAYAPRTQQVKFSDLGLMHQEDVVDNHFNILRMFVSVYGTSTAPTMLAKCISEAEEKYDRLLKALDPEVSSCYQRRCEEATKEEKENKDHGDMGKYYSYHFASNSSPSLLCRDGPASTVYGSNVSTSHPPIAFNAL